MSLINEVLRDLDARHAADSERIGLAHQVRALPPKPVSLWKKVLWPVLTACLGGAVVWLLLARQAAPNLAPASAPVAEAAAPVPETSAIEPPVAEASAAISAHDTVPLKLDVEMASAPAVVPAPPVPKEKPPAAIKPRAEIESPKVALPRMDVAKVDASKLDVPKVEASKPKAGAAERSLANPPAQINKQLTGGNGSMNEQAEAEYRRGLTALRRGAATEAGEAFRAALKLQSNHVSARHALLSQLVEQRQWQAVEVVAMDGLGTTPNRHDWALLAARVQFDRGEVTQALDTLSHHAAYARQSADYQVFHALLLQRVNRPAEAVVCYQTALSINPAEGRWWYGLARALDADQREQEARAAYEKARDSGNLPPDLAQAVERRLR